MSKKYYCADIETDGFDSTKIHVLGICELVDMKPVRSFTVTDYSKIKDLMADESITWVFHNGMKFDKIELERVLDCKIKGDLIDTLAISWYLEPKRIKHGLADYGEEFGVPKPIVEDWQNQPIEVYIERVEEDVKIQTILWRQQWKHLNLLYDTPEEAFRCATYLSRKLEVVALAKRGWKLNQPDAKELLQKLTEKHLEAVKDLEKAMPRVPVYQAKSRPKKPFKKNGDLSAIGIRWDILTKEEGYDFDFLGEIKVLTSYKEPNANSHSQVKSWLVSLGWKPQTFDHKRDKESGNIRKIPQVKNSDGDDVCNSIKELFNREPSLKHLSDKGVVAHRISVINGFLNNVDDRGMLFADCSGFTNTLRLKHRTLVNIPSVRKPYGKEIRGLLTARTNKSELVGSDMSSLEDRTKLHYMTPHDPEYVEDMSQEGFDPHCDLSLIAGIMTKEETDTYKDESCSKEELKRLSALRYAGKTGNYACTYGAGAATIARGAGVSEAIGEKIHKGYWERNWSLKAIADECLVKTSRGMKWLYNPVSGLWLHLKTDKDRFSTLNQSTGSFLFDKWVDNILAKRPQINGQFHDEVILEVKKGCREGIIKLLKEAIQDVNKEYKLNRDLDVDVDFGDNYSEIH